MGSSREQAPEELQDAPLQAEKGGNGGLDASVLSFFPACHHLPCYLGERVD